MNRIHEYVQYVETPMPFLGKADLSSTVQAPLLHVVVVTGSGRMNWEGAHFTGKDHRERAVEYFAGLQANKIDFGAPEHFTDGDW